MTVIDLRGENFVAQYTDINNSFDYLTLDNAPAIALTITKYLNIIYITFYTPAIII